MVLKRRLPSDLGGLALLVSPDASLKYWGRDLQSIDPMLLNAVRNLVLPSDVIWDVGANVGLFGFASAGLATRDGNVLAIEPDPWLAQRLRESCLLKENAGYRIDILSVAIGDRIGTAVLNIAQRGRATNFISGLEPSTQAGGIRASVHVISVTLDWLLDFWPSPSVVKIDVEGSEASVLRGARRLLSKVRPKIICEVSARNRSEVSEIFRAMSYAMYDAETYVRGASPLPDCAWNTIALPAETNRIAIEAC